MDMKGKETVLVIPDMQMPFHHQDTVPFLKAVKNLVRPTEVVCIGDSIDGYMLSMWDHEPEAMNVADEYEAAMRSLKEIYKLFPVAREVLSNHNERIAKKILAGGLPAAFVKSYEEIMQYPAGWSIHPFVTIDNVTYEHGHAQGGQYAAINLAAHNGTSTVIGHHHSHGGVQYRANRNKTIFGMNVGCLIDVSAYAFKYADNCKFKVTLGCGVVRQGVPFFVPMLVDAKNRWRRNITHLAGVRQG